MKTIIILTICFWFSTFCFAELPPKAYLAMKRKAPEQLLLLVEEVRLDSTQNHSEIIGDYIFRKVKITATVRQIYSSETSLQEGDTICIEYAEKILPPNSRFVDNPVKPMLNKHTLYKSFLRIGKNSSYELAADMHSFEKISSKP